MAEIEQAILSNLNAFVGFARKRLEDPELAADAVQESLLKALKSARPPRAEDKMIAWFYQILRRTIIDIYRHRAVRDDTLRRFEHEVVPEPDAKDEAVICECFRRLIPTLPPNYQQVLNRIDLEGAEPKKLAEDLHVSWNNFNVRLHRARAALREKLEETCQACSVHGCLDCTCSASAERAAASS